MLNTVLWQVSSVLWKKELQWNIELFVGGLFFIEVRFWNYFMGTAEVSKEVNVLMLGSGSQCEGREINVREIRTCCKFSALFQKSGYCTRRHQWIVKVKEETFGTELVLKYMYFLFPSAKQAYKQYCLSSNEPLRTQVLATKYHSPLREPGLFEEMSVSRAGTSFVRK